MKHHNTNRTHHTRRTRHTHRLLPTLTLALASVFATQTAMAQETYEIIEAPAFVHRVGFTEFTELLRPQVHQRDARIVSKALSLDDSQRAILEALIEDYVARFDLAAKELRDAQRRTGFPGSQQLDMMSGGVFDADMNAEIMEAVQQAMEANGEDGGRFEININSSSNRNGQPGERAVVIAQNSGSSENNDDESEEVIIWATDEDSDSNSSSSSSSNSSSDSSSDSSSSSSSDSSTNSSSDSAARRQPGRIIQAPPGATTASNDDSDVAVMVSATDQDGNALIDPEVIEELTKRLQDRIAARLAEIEANNAANDEQRTGENTENNNDNESPEPITSEELKATATTFRNTRTQLYADFIGDLELILNKAQAEHLKPCMQAVRRINDLPRGRFAGENIDVDRLIQTLELESLSDSLADDVINTYIEQLDQALAHRQQTLINNEINAIDLIDEENPKERLRMVDAASAARTAVRDLNRNTIQSIAQELEESEAAKLKNEFKTRAFPAVARPARGERAIQAALQLEDLADETRNAILELKNRYQMQFDQTRTQIMDAMITHQPHDERRMMEFLSNLHEQRLDAANGEFEFQGPEPSPVEESFDAQRTLDTTVLKELKAILPEEQFAQLPPTVRRRSMFPQGGPMIRRIEMRRD